MTKRLPVIWDADQHTIAKISILKGYLNAWFRILGLRMRNQTILYVDGFAGPGRYKNHPEGSPLAALRAAENAVSSLGNEFCAAGIHCAFIESSTDRFAELCEAITPYERLPRIEISKFNTEFVPGMALLRAKLPGAWTANGPLFVFADPFGATGIPFATLQETTASDAAELLINLDADGAGRILQAKNRGHEAQLTELFGTESWQQALTAIDNLKELTVQVLDLYKLRLLQSGFKFVWAFEMRGKNDTLNYYLVFATKHPLGMEKMKEAMRRIDESGTYCFSDAHANQQVLFGADDADFYAARMFENFRDTEVSWGTVNAFALSETPFTNSVQMLALLQRQNKLSVVPLAGEKLRAGSFPQQKVASLRFGYFGSQETFTI